MSEDVSREVDQLLKDRERYESWLERLEGQKAEASSRAYERVRNDYRQRLEDVLRRLTGHSESIKGKLTDLAQKAASLDKERTGRSEELDEARLRHLVGEYGDDKDWHELEQRLLGALHETEAQIDEVRGEARQLEEIVAVVERPPERPARPPEVEKPPEPERVEERHGVAPAAEPEEPESAVTVEERPVTSTLPPEVIEVAVAAEEAPTEEEAAVESLAPEPGVEEASPGPPPPPPPPRPEPAPARPPRREVAEAGTRGGDEGYLSLGDLVLEDSDLEGVLSEPAGAQPETPAEPEPEAEEGGEVGDELAFLESLSLGADEESEGFSFLEQRGSGTPQTIICPHCSAANDPAEWYCTECGEELPAE